CFSSLSPLSSPLKIVLNLEVASITIQEAETGGIRAHAHTYTREKSFKKGERKGMGKGHSSVGRECLPSMHEACLGSMPSTSGPRLQSQETGRAGF
ncbi:hypothetical protein U0070_010064, partial [Myodes glareolus]